MKRICWAAAALAGMALAGQAHASTMPITFSGPGVSGSLEITFGPGTDAKYPNAFEITGVSGTFSDSNNGLTIVNAPVGPLKPITHDTPESGNLLAPDDFSRFAVATGLPPDSNGFVTYDNLFWPGGAPPTATDFDGAGGFLDIYGLMFGIGHGIFVDLFDNGVSPTKGINYGGYGVAVVTSETTLDYVSAGVSASTPEPSTWAMMVLGFAGLGFAGYRKSRKAAAIAA
jgi:PEP-CTERM motif